MRALFVVFSILMCCGLCLDEPYLTVFTSPRAMLVYMLALWLRCEWCDWQADAAKTNSKRGMVKENYELSQTVLNLSEQHRLLCEIRNTVLKSLRYSKDTFVEVRFPAAIKHTLSSSSFTESKGSPDSKSNEPMETTPPLSETTQADQVRKAKAAFLCGSMSESSLLRKARAAFLRGSMSESSLSLRSGKRVNIR